MCVCVCVCACARWGALSDGEGTGDGVSVVSRRLVFLTPRGEAGDTDR